MSGSTTSVIGWAELVGLFQMSLLYHFFEEDPPSTVFYESLMIQMTLSYSMDLDSPLPLLFSNVQSLIPSRLDLKLPIFSSQILGITFDCLKEHEFCD
uniref:Ovule protein n=1 Tax=Caenorhabditis tropicalis TaxID=1561998 RepID=A0A1I7TFE9_9PELO